MILQDLGDGLVIRQARADDTETLAAFNGTMHADPEAGGLDAGVAAWTCDLMQGRRPGTDAGDFLVVEDQRRGLIVSSLGLISQTWSYGGVPFAVGQIEAVATHPDYRRRGLIRRQFEIVHRWSRERGELVQVIDGIPWYYRQFGYEFALALELDGGRSVDPETIAAPAGAGCESVRLRPATAADLSRIAQLVAKGQQRSLVACLRDAALWRYELEGRSERNALRREFHVIETAAGAAAGFLATMPLGSSTLTVTSLELATASWRDLVPCALRTLLAPVNDRAATGRAPIERISLRLGSEHPAYAAIPGHLAPPVFPAAWYVRIADLSAFLRQIAPVLEARLAATTEVAFSGELRLNFYRSGLRLVFAGGKLAQIEPWPQADAQLASASFPDHTFLPLLFGYRSLDDLAYAFPDCGAATAASRHLLNTLFPKQPSFAWRAI